MRLDLLNPRVTTGTNSGTPDTPPGVFHGDVTTALPPPAVRRPLRGRSLLLVACACLSLLGQGERYRLDPRYRSPSATLMTLWESLREGDGDRAFDCMVEGRHDLPSPGALWFLPPTEDLWLAGFRSLPVTSGRVMVTYEVHYRPRGSSDERMFKTGAELVRQHGEWRIAQPLGQASMPDWKPVPGPVDI